MNAEQITHYQKLCRNYSLEINFDYINTDLDQIMSLGIWKNIIYKQLKHDEKRLVRSYINTLKFPDAGLLETQIKQLEELAKKCVLLFNQELNSRWAIRNVRTGLYWCSMTYPCWGRSDRAFLFLNEKEAQHWANRFIKTTKEFEFEAAKLNATKQLKRCPF